MTLIYVCAMKYHSLVFLVALSACSAGFDAQPDAISSADASNLTDAQTIEDSGDMAGQLPFERQETVQNGQPVDASLYNGIQDAIVTIVTPRVFVGWLGNSYAMAGSLDFSSTGALRSTAALTATMSPSWSVDYRLARIRVRVKDNGADIWSAVFGAVNEDDVIAIAPTVMSSGGGTWEYLTITIPFTIGIGDRMLLSLSTPNGAATEMLSQGAEFIYGP